MKGSLKRLFLLFSILLLGVLLVPNLVNAENNSSDYVGINKYSYSLKGDGFTLSNVYFSKSTWSAGGLTTYGTLYGSMLNTSDRSLSVYMTIDYYDEDYNIVARSNKTEKPIDDSTYQMNIILYENDFIGDATVDDIAYYKINYYTSKGNYLTGSDSSNISSGISASKPSQNGSYSYYDYVIDKYSVDIKVNENNTLDITETITTYFNTPKHGIYRTIPLVNNVTRLDGTSSKNRAKVSDLSVSENYSKKRVGTNLMVQIGSANETVTGEKTYVIKYNYNLGKDPSKDYDELYYNIIGTDWDTVIGNITFNITMPKKFDASKLGFSSGYQYSTDSSNIEYTLDENIISGSYKGILQSSEALTVRCELPEGYFVGAKSTISIASYVLMFIPILFLIVAILLWHRYGKDEKPVETVEFYPPDGFNSLEVGFLYKGKATSQDVTSLLIYLANKGYIKITEIDEKSLFTVSKGFKITKLKEYDGNNINEKLFIKGLFKSPFHGNSLDELSPSNSVTSIDLYDNFYVTASQIISNIDNKENRSKIFEKGSFGKRALIVVMIIITYLLITVPPVIDYGMIEALFPALIFPGIGFTVLFAMVFGGPQKIYVNGKETNSAIVTKIFGLVWGGFFGGAPWVFLVLPALLQDHVYFMGYVAGIVCVLGMVLCFKFMPKRTPYGTEILGKILGFKNFLETVEKEKLEALVMQDPEYFYNILPYTYVLGVSDKWIKKFESISMQAPTWYDSPNAFDMMTFGTFMNTTMTAANRVMSTSSSSSSGGGGSSGGGSSGGGSGGGGGGSW